MVEYDYGTADGINHRLSRVESITNSGGSVTTTTPLWLKKAHAE